MLKTGGSRVRTSVWPRFFVCQFICLFGEGKIKGFRGICALRVPFSSFFCLKSKNILKIFYGVLSMLNSPFIFAQPPVPAHFNHPAKAGYCNHLRVSVCLFVCLFVSRISHKLLVGFWRNLVSREVMIIGRRSSKLGVIRIEIRIWDPDNCFPWTTGRIFGWGFQSDPG